MRKDGHSEGYFQPVLLLILAAAVILGAVVGMKTLAAGYLKDKNGDWADRVNETVYETATQAQTQSQETAAASEATEAPVQTEAQTETQPQTESEAVDVYLVLKTSCNFRSGPSMDAEIYGTKDAGTTVKFLEDLGGWYKVEIDGVVGYMGSQFF